MATGKNDAARAEEEAKKTVKKPPAKQGEVQRTRDDSQKH